MEPDHGREPALEASVNLLSTILASTHDGYWRVDAGGRLLDVNPAYCRMSGYSRDELIGKRIEDLNPFLDRVALIQRMKAITEQGSARFRSRHQAKDGHLFEVELHAIRISEGGHSICFIQDITPLVQQEQKLRESEARLRDLLDGAPLAIAMTRGGKLIYVNSHYVVMHGFLRAEELLGTPILDRVFAEDHPLFQGFPDQVARGEILEPTIEFRALRKDQTGFWVTATVRPLSLDDGPAAIGFLRNISDRKRAEQERETLIQDLQEALAKVKVLRGLIPICGHCKKIRDDQGYWNQLEAYITSHTEAAFSHGICPDCARTYFPEFMAKQESNGPEE